MALHDVPSTDIIHAVLQSVIDGIVAVYAAEEIDLPDRHILAVDSTAHDCEQLTATFNQLYVGGPGDEAEQPMRCNSPRSLVLTVQLVRCIPTPTSRGSAPSPEAMSASTAELMRDAWLMLEGVMSSEAAEYLGALADVSVTPPSGGFQAVQVNLVVGIP